MSTNFDNLDPRIKATISATDEVIKETGWYASHNQPVYERRVNLKKGVYVCRPTISTELCRGDIYSSLNPLYDFALTYEVCNFRDPVVPFLAYQILPDDNVTPFVTQEEKNLLRLNNEERLKGIQEGKDWSDLPPFVKLDDRRFTIE